jgi:hypothetical protein
VEQVGQCFRHRASRRRAIVGPAPLRATVQA